MVERAPVYPAMFSELPHMPATMFRFKNRDRVPAFVDREFHAPEHNAADLTARSRPDQVSGPNRHKHLRRPMLAAPDQVIIRLAPSVLVPAPPPPAPEPRSKTLGTQSDYRENDAQTLPWEPPASLPEAGPSAKQAALSSKHHTEGGPELQYLAGLKFGDGLPPGLQEVNGARRGGV